MAGPLHVTNRPVDLLIFDLDGTLIDSRLDLAHAVNAARAHLGLPPLDDDLVVSYVGNGAPALIRRALGEQATESSVREALEFFLANYRAHALECTTLYPGVAEAIVRLHRAGKRLAILTNKPAAVSREIVEGLGIGGFFFRIYGGDSFEFKKPNPIGVEALRTETGAGREETMMAGDSSVDIQTARNAGVRSCGVTYGLQPESLSDPAPDLLVDRMGELADWILGGETLQERERP
jgi:phosphoglycolate phosphatase